MAKSNRNTSLEARLSKSLLDSSPEEIRQTSRMLTKIGVVDERYGVEPLDAPAIEYTDAVGTFLRNQDRPNAGVFSFQGEDEQSISLRYDPPRPARPLRGRELRPAAEALPLLCRRPPWPNEKPGPGRFRQLTQFDTAARQALPPSEIEALDAQAQRLMAAFTRAGYERISPAVIQPAGLFLDVVGESLRARTYVFTDPDGAELCLRPDLTVPTCRLHLERHADANTPARYCYSGSAFRYQPARADRAHPREFRQAGIESFAAPDREQDDAAVLALVVETLRDAGLDGLKLRLGDLGLFTALIDALDMPERWRRRIEHQFWRPEAFRAELARLTSGAARATDLPRVLLDKVDPADPTGAEMLVLEHLDKAGHELIGTRTAAEIAQRLLDEAADRREQPLPAATAALIESYVAVKAPARTAVDRLAKLARESRIDLSVGLDAFKRRLDLIEGAGVTSAEAEFSGEFGRNLEYYTGFVFEIIAPALGPRSPIAGGGRYDSLLAEVGAAAEVPAVGACIHTERLLAVLQGAAS